MHDETNRRSFALMYERENSETIEKYIDENLCLLLTSEFVVKFVNEAYIEFRHFASTCNLNSVCLVFVPIRGAQLRISGRLARRDLR